MAPPARASSARLDKLKHVPQCAARKLSAVSFQLSAFERHEIVAACKKYGGIVIQIAEFSVVGPALACHAGRQPGQSVPATKGDEVRLAMLFGRARAFLAAAALFALFWWLSPPEEPSFHLCPFYWLTARPCPLCGITRAFCALAKGHWAQAIHFHALSPLAFVMLFSLFWKFRWRAPLWTWGLAAIGTYGIVRAAGI